MAQSEVAENLSLVIACWDRFQYDNPAEFAGNIDVAHTYTFGVRLEVFFPDETQEDYEQAVAASGERVC